MLVSGLKGRPTYPGLTPDLFAKQNIIVADLEGAAAVMGMLRRAGDAFAWRSTILLIARASPEIQSGLKPAMVWTFPTLATALIRLSAVLGTARMGMRLYAAGDETLLGSVIKSAMENGIGHSSVRTEHRGSTKRRIQCVHCNGLTNDVTTKPVTCIHCGTALLVRDHYSRRIGAFMGVRVDAEAPGDIPGNLGEFK